MRNNQRHPIPAARDQCLSDSSKDRGEGMATQSMKVDPVEPTSEIDVANQ
jgi:hypothetical protein